MIEALAIAITASFVVERDGVREVHTPRLRVRADMRMLAKAHRDQNRARGLCINTPRLKLGTTHGMPVSGGRCERCAAVHARSRDSYRAIRSDASQGSATRLASSQEPTPDSNTAWLWPCEDG